jgi:hypothetical protein
MQTSACGVEVRKRQGMLRAVGEEIQRERS